MKERLGFNPEDQEAVKEEKNLLLKIMEKAKLLLNLRRAGEGSRNQLPQVERQLSELLDARIKRMVLLIEDAYNTAALKKGTDLLDFKNQQDRKVLKEKWGIDLNSFPYVVNIDTVDGLEELLRSLED
ncbi:hypothetical protein KAZ57_03915 [Patescibacteria group bacterium]|nr:hypothetical protein [Patescibacteria group bacterium]